MRHLELLGWGSVGIVYKVTETIAVQRVKKVNEDNSPVDEHLMFDLLDKNPKCPNLVQSFYRVPSAIFLQLMSGGILDRRLRERQKRDPNHDVVTEVKDRLQKQSPLNPRDTVSPSDTISPPLIVKRSLLTWKAARNSNPDEGSVARV